MHFFLFWLRTAIHLFPILAVKKFILRVLLFLLIVLLIDRLFIIFRPNETNIFADIAIKKMATIQPLVSNNKHFDILVTGSSHSQFGVSPEIISSVTNKSSLNIAYGNGANIGLQLSILKQVIQHNIRPGTILFGLDVFALNPAPQYTDVFQDKLFNREKTIKALLNSKFLYSYCKLYARFIPAYIDSCKKGNKTLPYFSKKEHYNLSMFSRYERTEITQLGWVKGFGEMDTTYLRYSDLVFHPDPAAKRDLEEYISLCKENNISLIFFQIPENARCLKFSRKYEEFDKFIRQLASANRLTYFDFNNKTAYPVDNDAFFFDSDHLSYKGATAFSLLLAKEVKRAGR